MSSKFIQKRKTFNIFDDQIKSTLHRIPNGNGKTEYDVEIIQRKSRKYIKRKNQKTNLVDKWKKKIKKIGS